MTSRFVSTVLKTGTLTLQAALVLFSTSILASGQENGAQDSSQDSQLNELLQEAMNTPTYTGAYLSGQVADFDNDVELAMNFYSRALELAPDSLDAKRRLFSLLLLADEFDRASELALDLKEDAELALLAQRTLAVRAVQKREYRNVDRHLRLDETDPVDYLINNLISAWAKFGDNQTDEAFAQMASLEGPAWMTAFKDFNIGMLAMAAGQNERAVEHLTALAKNQDAIQITPDTFLEGVMALAILHHQTGNSEEAANVLTSNIQASYPPADALLRKINAGDDIAYPVTSASDGSAAAFYTIGAAINQEGFEEIVGLLLQFARALDPDNAPTLITLAGLQEQLDRPEKAIEIYSNVPDTSPMKRLSELQLGLNLADTGKIDEALSHIDAVLQIYTNDIRAYVSYGRILSREKRYDEMVANYERAVKAVGPIHNASHWNLFYQLGIAYERSKIWDKAEDAFLRALDLSPNQPDVMNYLGYSWIDMNINLERGIEMIQNAVNLRPNDGYIVDSLGWAHYRQGRFDEAVRELERAVELRPSDPTINDHLGDAFWQVGRQIEARFQWERALNNMAEFDEDLIPVLEKKLKEGLPEEPAKTDG